MKTIKLLIFAFLLTGIISCKDDQKLSDAYVEPAVSTYYLIRHAEKIRSNSDDIDPELSQKGLGRAMHWAEILSDVELDAIYSTDFERTTMTAAPTSVKQEVTVQYYDSYNFDIEQFQIDNLGKNVLIVGHSDSTPDFVNKLLGENKYADMDDYDNGSLFIVQVTDENVSANRLYFNCNCPD